MRLIRMQTLLFVKKRLPHMLNTYNTSNRKPRLPINITVFEKQKLQISHPEILQPSIILNLIYIKIFWHAKIIIYAKTLVEIYQILHRY